MRISRRLSLALAGALVSLLLLSASASAAPITVNLRVEGSSTTLYEGNVSTDALTIEAPNYETSGPAHPHLCDVNDNGEFPSGTFGSSYGNPTTALYDAAISLGLTFNSHWYEPLHDFFVDGVGPAGPKGSESWGYAVNYTTASVGGCQFQLAPGSEVLWAANFGLAKHLLSLSGPSSVGVGMPFTVHVVDGQTGEPLSGAAIGTDVAGVTSTGASSPTTDAAGNATVTLTQAGATKLKAIRSESVRSNGLVVCVHNGEDGTCGTQLPSVICALSFGGRAHEACAPPLRLPPYPIPAEVARVNGIANGRVFRRHHGPRVLRGDVEVLNGGTLRQVRIRLERRYRGRCWDFSGSRVRFVRARKCGTASFFSVGGSESFSYLLPAPLPNGRYVYDIEGVDSAGHPTKLVSGVSHVVFRVK
jgi:hypothetical protein